VVVVLVAKDLSDLFADPRQIREIETAVFPARSPHTDEGEVRGLHGVLGGRRRTQPPALHATSKQVRQTWFDNRAAAFIDRADLVGDDIHADDLMAIVSKRGGGDAADISETEH
jgi:hypothetical protein